MSLFGLPMYAPALKCETLPMEIEAQRVNKTSVLIKK